MAGLSPYLVNFCIVKQPMVNTSICQARIQVVVAKNQITRGYFIVNYGRDRTVDTCNPNMSLITTML
jgi:hypothetical protein